MGQGEDVVDLGAGGLDVGRREQTDAVHAHVVQDLQLLVAAAPGKNSSVAAAMRDLGATVLKREDSIDYLRVQVPTGKAGAAKFTADNPTYDGRGTTIGILDTGVDLDHPTLRTTTTGERRITDWVTATDPTSDNDPTWVGMADQVSRPAFTYQSIP